MVYLNEFTDRKTEVTKEDGVLEFLLCCQSKAQKCVSADFHKKKHHDFCILCQRRNSTKARFINPLSIWLS